MRISFCIALLIGVVLLVPAYASLNTSFGRWAIVIGNAEYQEIVDLEFPVADAEVMTAVLEATAFRVQKLTNASYSQIAEAFSQLAEDLAQEREENPEHRQQVVIYYSGQGASIAQVGGEITGALVPVDIKRLEMEPRVDEAELCSWLDELGSAAVTVILDCGHVSAEGLAAPGRQILTAAGRNKCAWEDGALGHGAFTYFLLERLAIGNVDDTRVSLQEAFHYAQVQIGKLSPEMNPEMAGKLEEPLLFSVTNVRSALQEVGHPFERQIWAVVVGIGDYQARSIHDLSYTEADAQAIHDWLLEKAKVPEEHVQLLLGEEATLAGIRRALYWLIDVSCPGDIVLFYFSGHSTSGEDYSGDEADKLDEFLVPYDAVPDFIEHTGLGDDELNHIFQVFEEQQAISVFDCGSGMEPGELAGPGRLVILSAGKDGNAYEDDVLRHGVFTYYFLKGLEKGDSNGDRKVSLQEAFGYTQTNVRDYAIKAWEREQWPEMIDGIKAPVFLEILLGGWDKGGGQSK